MIFTCHVLLHRRKRFVAKIKEDTIVCRRYIPVVTGRVNKQNARG